MNILNKAMTDGHLPIAAQERLRELEDDIAFGDFAEFHQKASPLLKSAYRHQTREQKDIQEIQKNWNQRRRENAMKQLDRYRINFNDYYKLGKLFDEVDLANPQAFNAQLEKFNKKLAKIAKSQTTTIKFSAEQLDQFKEMEKFWGIKRDAPMSTYEADEQNTNPDYAAGTGTSINCQTCAPAYMLRLQGLNVKATSNDPGSLNEYISKATLMGSKWRYNTHELWKNQDGSDVMPSYVLDWAKKKGITTALTPEQTLEYFNDTTKDPGVYELILSWKGGGGHATILQRFDDGSLARIEPQVFNGTMKRDVKQLAGNISTMEHGKFYGYVLRIDDKLIDKKYWSIFTKK